MGRSIAPCRSLVDRIALALAYGHDYNDDFLVAHFVDQAVTHVTKLDLVAVWLAGQPSRRNTRRDFGMV